MLKTMFMSLILIPATVYVGWLAQQYFERRRARVIQVIVGVGTLLSISLAAFVDLVPDSAASVIVLRIFVLATMRILLPTAIIGLTLPMAYNYFRVASGRLRVAIDTVCAALMATSVFIEDAILTAAIVLVVLGLRYIISAR